MNGFARSKTRFDTEAKCNSEMAYLTITRNSNFDLGLTSRADQSQIRTPSISDQTGSELSRFKTNKISEE